MDNHQDFHPISTDASPNDGTRGSSSEALLPSKNQKKNRNKEDLTAPAPPAVVVLVAPGAAAARGGSMILVPLMRNASSSSKIKNAGDHHHHTTIARSNDKQLEEQESSFSSTSALLADSNLMERYYSSYQQESHRYHPHQYHHHQHYHHQHHTQHQHFSPPSSQYFLHYPRIFNKEETAGIQQQHYHRHQFNSFWPPQRPPRTSWCSTTEGTTTPATKRNRQHHEKHQHDIHYARARSQSSSTFSFSSPLVPQASLEHGPPRCSRRAGTADQTYHHDHNAEDTMPARQSTFAITLLPPYHAPYRSRTVDHCSRSPQSNTHHTVLKRRKIGRQGSQIDEHHARRPCDDGDDRKFSIDNALAAVRSSPIHRSTQANDSGSFKTPTELLSPLQLGNHWDPFPPYRPRTVDHCSRSPQSNTHHTVLKRRKIGRQGSQIDEHHVRRPCDDGDDRTFSIDNAFAAVRSSPIHRSTQANDSGSFKTPTELLSPLQLGNHWDPFPLFPEIMFGLEEKKKSSSATSPNQRAPTVKYNSNYYSQEGAHCSHNPLKIVEEIGEPKRISNEATNSSGPPSLETNMRREPKSTATEYEIRNLLLSTDRQLATSFTLGVFDQLQIVLFEEGDRSNHRTHLPLQFAGFACLHCKVPAGKRGRYFPSTMKSMTDCQKTLFAIQRHLLKCKHCPAYVKKNLICLLAQHSTEKDKLSIQKPFFARIWNFLRAKDGVE